MTPHEALDWAGALRDGGPYLLAVVLAAALVWERVQNRKLYDRVIKLVEADAVTHAGLRASIDLLREVIQHARYGGRDT